jgi:hypothetical protein
MAEQLTPKQNKAVAALLATSDALAAARAAGVTRGTLYTWMRAPAFRAALHEAEAAALNAVSRSLVRLAEKAVTTIEAAMNDTSAPMSVRLRAADAVLGRLLQLRELVTLEERVRELEERLGDAP